MKNTKWIFAVVFLCFFGIGYFVFFESGSFILASKGHGKNRKTELGETGQTLDKTTGEPIVLMNDPAIAQNWGIGKVNAQRAWALTKGKKEIVVAVIDTGCDVEHEDLKGNIWKNNGEIGKDEDGKEKSTNRKDDDGNGFVDDVHGWNFVSNDNQLTDNHGHGTHIAGIIGAEAGNGKGIAGISPDVSIMCLKYFDPKVPNTDNLRNTIQGIRYAIKMKANIINYSGGGTEFSEDEKGAIEEARKAGILFVAAAGNERSNSDVHHYYPADYGLSNIISVTAVDPSVSVLPSSNYGTNTVDIAAPGQNILSLLPNSSYGYMTGTSQATAFVTGAAVLVMARKNITEPELIKKYILSTGDVDSKLLTKTANYRKLNLYNSLAAEDGGVSSNGTKSIPVADKFNPSEQQPKTINDFGNKLNSFFEKKTRSATGADQIKN